MLHKNLDCVLHLKEVPIHTGLRAFVQSFFGVCQLLIIRQLRWQVVVVVGQSKLQELLDFFIGAATCLCVLELVQVFT